jgi:hypothetical protein
MKRRLGLAFERCYDLDDDVVPTPRPAFLSPAALAAAAMMVAVCFALLLATPFWNATAPPPERGPAAVIENSTAAAE